MIDKLLERLKEISQKLYDLTAVSVMLSIISALICIIHNSMFLTYLGIGTNKLGIGFYDLINFDQSLLIFSFLVLLYFALSLMLLGKFIKFMIGLFLFQLTLKLLPLQIFNPESSSPADDSNFLNLVRNYDGISEFFRVNYSSPNFYWFIAFSVLLAIAVFEGKKTIEIIIFGDEKSIPKSIKGKLSLGFLLAYVVLLFLGLWLVATIFAQDLGWLFVEKASAIPSLRFIILLFIVLSWWLYIYFWNDKKDGRGVLPSMAVVILFYATIQPLLEADLVSRYRKTEDKIEIELVGDNNQKISSYLVRNFPSGILLINENKISFVKSEQIKGFYFLN